jgi:hypothetical protein
MRGGRIPHSRGRVLSAVILAAVALARLGMAEVPTSSGLGGGAPNDLATTADRMN